jgi:hypothetical protein
MKLLGLSPSSDMGADGPGNWIVNEWGVAPSP